jgi:glycopeptide antibiotics resistance protein
VPAALWIAWTLFIVYACTIPFHFSADLSLIAGRLRYGVIYPWRARDPFVLVSVPDFIGNILLFVPFGVLGAVTLRPRSRGWFVWVVLLGCALSTIDEALQLLTDDRIAALSDILANTAGAAVGAIVCERVAATARRAMRMHDPSGLTSAPAFYPAMIAVIVLVVSVWEPFTFSTDVSEIAHKVRAFARDPWRYSGLNDEGVMALRFLLAGVAVHVWLRQTRYARYATAATLAALALAAVGLEGTQFIISSRTPAGEDAFVMVVGGMIGVLLARKEIHRARPAVLAGLLLTATAASAAMQTLSPFAIASFHRSVMLFPFLNYYKWTSLVLVSHTFELLLMYFPLGFCLPLVVTSRRLGWVAVLLTVLIMAASLEYLQGWIEGRYSDVTDLIISLLGAMIGAWAAGPGWDVFRKGLGARGWGRH